MSPVTCTMHAAPLESCVRDLGRLLAAGPDAHTVMHHAASCTAEFDCSNSVLSQGIFTTVTNTKEHKSEEPSHECHFILTACFAVFTGSPGVFARMTVGHWGRAVISMQAVRRVRP